MDIIGNAYEYLIKNFATTLGKLAGDSYTQSELSDLITTLFSPKLGDNICDPACGSGSLLIKFGRHIAKNFNSKNYSLYGQETIGSTWSIAKMNMFLRNEDNHRIEWGDTLRNPKLIDNKSKLLKFDIVTSALPFSLNNWGYEEAKQDRF